MSSKMENKELNLGLGQRIKLLRENLNLSRKMLAEMIDITDMFLTQVELGQKGVSHVTLCKIAKALCTTTDYLLTGQNDASDVTAITSMLGKMEPPVVRGAENILKEYLNSVNYFRCATNQSEQDNKEADK